MLRRHADLLACLASVLIVDVLALVRVEGPFRLALGGLVVLLVPGYVLLAAAFPARRRTALAPVAEDGERVREVVTESGLDAPERLAIGAGIGAALLVLLQLLHAVAPWGMGPLPTLATLTVLVAAGCAFAWRRRERLGAEAFATPPFRVPSLGEPGPGRTVLALALAAVLLAGAYLLVTPREPDRFTEFYVFGAQGDATSYPTNLTAGEQGTLVVGIVNREARDVTYALRLVVAPLDGGAGRELAAWDVRVGAGETREEPRTFEAPAAGQHVLRIELRREGDPAPYRELRVPLRVT